MVTAEEAMYGNFPNEAGHDANQDADVVATPGSPKSALYQHALAEEGITQQALHQLKADQLKADQCSEEHLQARARRKHAANLYRVCG